MRETGEGEILTTEDQDDIPSMMGVSRGVRNMFRVHNDGFSL